MTMQHADKGDWIATKLARDVGDWPRVHISHHEQYDGMAPGQGRLVVTDGVCQACGALVAPARPKVRCTCTIQSGTSVYTSGCPLHS
jgi:hypothetical protein